MRRTDLSRRAAFLVAASRTSTFRLAVAFVTVFALMTLLLFSFIYWQTAVFETQRIGKLLVTEARVLRAEPPEQIIPQIQSRITHDLHRVSFGGLFTPDLRIMAGNIPSYPTGLPVDGRAHLVDPLRLSWPWSVAEGVQAVAVRLPNNDVLVIGRNIDALVDLRNIVLRALALGVVPAALLSILAGTILSLRTLARVRQMHETSERIIRGDFHERLPTRGSRDDLDRLASAVNRMLAEIERLLAELRGVGDDIAHDLRTPLARVRTILERSRQDAASLPELQAAVDRALSGLDQAFAIIAALLRIREMESGLRRAGFGSIALGPIVQDIAELYEPIAEEKEITLRRGPIDATAEVFGDADLLMEALANLVDNAIKFTPQGGQVSLSVETGAGYPVLRVRDTGPGIPPAEHALVRKRFYRADKSRHVAGSGLGLSIVDAIARLHDFHLTIQDARPGCVMELHCGPGLHAPVLPAPAVETGPG